MSLHTPTRVGSEPDEAPAATWDLSIDLEFDPRLRPEEIRMLQHDLSDAVVEAVRKIMGPYVVGRPDTWLHDRRGCGSETPLFPMVAGAARFTCDLDVKEMIERACQGSPVSLMAHDACGRAYELTVAPVYLRRPQHDQERVAEMPDPERYAALGRGASNAFGGDYD